MFPLFSHLSRCDRGLAAVNETQNDNVLKNNSLCLSYTKSELMWWNCSHMRLSGLPSCCSDIPRVLPYPHRPRWQFCIPVIKKEEKEEKKASFHYKIRLRN